MTRRPGLSMRLPLLMLGLLLGAAAFAQAPDFQEVFESHGVSMLLIDPESGEIVDANPAAATFYGFARADLRGMSIERINTLDAEQVAEERALAERQGRNYFIFRHRLADGETRTVEVHSHPFEFDGRSLLLSIVQDITPGRNLEHGIWHYQQRLEDLVEIRTAEAAAQERLVNHLLMAGVLLLSLVVLALLFAMRKRRQAEARLRAFSRDFNAFLDQTTDFIYFKDAQSRIRFCSQPMARITGHDDWREMVGKHDRDLFPPDTAAIYEDEEQPIFREGRPLLNRVDPYYDDAGHRGYVQTNKWPLFDDAGRVIGVFGISRDITEHKVFEQTLAALNGELSRLAGADFFRAACRLLVEALGTDMAFVGKLEDDGRHVRVVEGWGDGAPIRPFEYALAGTPCAHVMKEGVASYPESVRSRFPNDHMLVEMGIESYVGQTLFGRQGLRLGILVTLGRAALPESHRTLAPALLELFVDRIASEIQRDEAERGLRFQLAFQRLTAEAATALATAVDGDAHDSAINTCLRQLGELFGVERAYLFLLNDEHSRMSNSHEWCAGGVGAQCERIQGMPMARLPWWTARMRRDGMAHVPDVRALPPEAVAERDEFAAQGVRALLTVAMYGPQGSLTGFLGLDSVQRPRSWSESEQVMLKTFAGIIGASIERKRTERQLMQAASVFEHANEGIMITDARGAIVDVNAAFARITGYDREEVLGHNPRILKSGEHDDAFYVDMWRALTAEGNWSSEIWNRRKDGSLFAEMLTISAVRGSDGEIQRYVGLFSDITEQKEQQRRLEYTAHYDMLTGLPNRVLLADRMQQAMAQAARRDEMIALVYLDLDGFKDINDSHGHDVGDRLLVALAERLKAGLRKGDTLARLGGDEFVVVLIDLPNVESSLPLLRRLLDAAARPVTDGDYVLQVTASLGVSFYPQPETIDADQLLRQADQAMYQAKLGGKNRYHLFDVDQDRSLRDQQEILTEIREALEKTQFVLHYQPKVLMRSGRLVGAEALIRWQHPERGLLSPAAFLPQLKDHALMVDLGDWVIDTALAQIAAWREAGLNLPVSVNVDAMQLAQPDFIARLRAALARHPGVQPGDLELEVVETSALQDMTHVSALMRECRELGVPFSLDDFGTGYSSLTYLKRLPVDALKIDQSFVRDMLDDPDDLAILHGVIGLAESFQRGVIAEGVETEVHGEMLLQMGCEIGQGYAIARPMPARELMEWQRHWRPSATWAGTRAVPHPLLPVLFSMVAHRAWVNALGGYLRGKQPAPPDLDASQCHFGRWLAETAREGGLKHPAFARILPLHDQVHQKAEELVALLHAGEGEQARARFEEIEKLRDALLAQMWRLLD